MRKEGLDRVIYKKMAMLVDLLLLVIKFIVQRLFRIKMDGDGPSKVETKCLLATVPEATGSEEVEEEEEAEEGGFVGFNEEEEEYTSNLSFKFEYQIPEPIGTSKEEEPSVLATDEVFPGKSTISISNCQSLAEKDFPGSVAEPEAMTCSVHEPFTNPGEEHVEPNFLLESFVSRVEEDTESKCSSAKDVRLPEDEAFVSTEEDDEPFIGGRSRHKFLPSKGFKNLKDVLLSKESLIGREDAMFLEDQKLGEEKPAAFDTKSWGEKEVSRGFFSGFDSDSDSTSSSDGYTVKQLVVDYSDSDGFLSEKDFGEEEESLMDSNRFEVELMEDVGNFELGQPSNSNAEFPYGSPMERSSGSISQLDEVWSMNDSSELELELERELKELNAGETEESSRPSSSCSLIELTDSDDDELPSSPSNRQDRVEKTELEEELRKSEDTRAKGLEAEELDELDSLWEDQDLSEQLKKVRAFGLPTILEESESPKTIEDLKPWKIDEKFLRKDPMDELHKFYKSYRERMRKLDILNNQKMYAMGLLQLKVPLQSMGSQKPLIPTILSHLSENLWPLHRRKSSNSASERFIKELQVDLETVYVGQTCLSWEFLRWQYEKARELPESDPYRNRQYNQVAGEFQKFQVMARRFIENEPFQGPRLPNYVENRCALRNLLQVPVIKEDCLKDKMEERKKDNDAITSEMLEDIMEESISIFWEFIKVDKDENSAILKTLIGNQVELQDPSDYSLMSDVRATLHKKDKKLKDILKTGNCIVKKFKKPREDRSNQDLFFSQVDMKLVSRVLKMSRIMTDQLVWCHMKLDKIKIAERKIHREPSFLLFPC